MGVRRKRFAQRRRAVGFSQERFAERLRVDRSTVARWEAGENEPLPWLRPELARVLRVSVDELDELLTESEEDGMPVDGPLRYALDHPAGVDLHAAASLRERVQKLDQRYDKVASTTLLADTGQCLGQVSFLRAHAATNRVRRELYAIEVEAATLMGQLLWDASQRRDHSTACMYFNQAIAVARQLHDADAEGLALLRMSFVALYGEKKDPRTGLDLALRAAQVTDRTSHVLAGLGVLHAAEAYAMIGQRQDCERSLADAETHFEQISMTDAAMDLFSPTQHGRLAGSCYLFLEDAKRAQPILESTAKRLQDQSKSQAIVLGNLAVAYIRQQKIEEAAAALHKAIDVVETTRGGGGMNVVFGAAQSLRPWRNVAEVQEVCDRLLGLMVSA
ncbi:helix-turn-helix domain-containing protein [Nocardia fusca]|uniref:helix-turn-helix domain-containing protein n=1 Tax=Nocardia fusca TaxID=941183 RepID=UPI0007A735A0|nr:helix-turn-helix transcriptional regulator [Nocardia fusca]